MGITPPEFLASLRSAHSGTRPRSSCRGNLPSASLPSRERDTPMRLIGGMGKGATGSFTAE